MIIPPKRENPRCKKGLWLGRNCGVTATSCGSWCYNFKPLLIEEEQEEITDPVLKEIVDWAISRREKLKIKKKRQKEIKPHDTQNQINLGAKMKTLQEVIDKCYGIERKDNDKGN
jgi:hypothetical protein